MITALVQLDNGSDRACHGWSSISGSVVSQVVVTSSAGDLRAAADARTLHDHLVVALRRHHATRVPTPCQDSFGPGADGCWASRHPGSLRRTLVWVANAAVSAPIVDLTPSTGIPWTSVLPILPRGTSPMRLPPQASASVARWYDPGAIDTTVPDVLIMAGLGLDQFRIFISYRWNDSRAFAEQLFDGLCHERFDVYLDRFRTDPGTNFVERIRAELADKACVLLLDSRDVSLSPWVAGEYAFARLYKLGLMAIDLPGGQQTFRRIGTRIDLRRSLRKKTLTSSTSLSSRAVDAAVAFVRANYFTEVSRRFRHQRRLVASSAALAHVAVRGRPDGLIETLGTPRSYLFAASARPPGIDTFRSVCEAAMPTGAKGVIIAPLFAQMHQGRENVEWLARSTGSAAVDERCLLRAMRRAASGIL